jgi:hypothetical protein
MRRIKILGLCLVAVSAMSIVGVTAAIAAPEYFEETKAKGKTPPQIVKLTKKDTFTSAGGESKLEGGVVITCEKDTSKGGIATAVETTKLKVTYTGCKAPSISSSCQKSPAKTGLISTENLHAVLTTASETKGGATTVVNKITPEGSKPFTKFTCGPKKELTVIVTGVIFAEQGPVNSPPSKTGFTINREKTAEVEFGCSKQQFLFENGAGTCQHLATGAGTSWNVSNDTITAKTPVEIKN